MDIDLTTGFLYDGWEYATYGGTAIYNTNPNPTRPEFTINGFDGDSLIVINIGLTTDCSVDLSELLFMNFDYDYTYIDTFGVLHKCTGNYTPPIEYNSSVRIPVLNVLSPLTPDELTIASIGESGEVGLQTEWFDHPVAPELCDTMTFNVLVKNVKQLVLLDLVPTFTLPTGLSVIPGSWEVAYPGGPVTLGAWTSIPNPDSVVGNTFAYTDDAMWSSIIDNIGLEGVSAANATEDENKVSFRFKATTNCNEFLSGSKLQTETSAGDPCSEGTVSSGIVDSPPVIINGANPAENAQLLMVSDPDELNCMATVNTFGITALIGELLKAMDGISILIVFLIKFIQPFLG